MHAESPGSEDSSSSMDESQGTDGDAEEEKGEEVKLEVSVKQFSPSEGKHDDVDVDDDNDDEDDDNGPEEGEVEEDGEDEDEEETEVGIPKKHKGETLKQSQDETVVEDGRITTQQEGQAFATQQQKHKVFQTIYFCYLFQMVSKLGLYIISSSLSYKKFLHENLQNLEYTIIYYWTRLY